MFQLKFIFSWTAFFYPDVLQISRSLPFVFYEVCDSRNMFWNIEA